MSNRTRMFLMVTLLLMAATSMMAAPDHDIEYFYYTDATKTEQCGYRILFCGGGVYSEGCRTAWYDVYHGPQC